MIDPWPDQLLIRPSQIARAGSFDVRVIYGLIRTGKLRALRVGNAWRIPRAAALGFLGENDGGDPDPDEPPPSINFGGLTPLQKRLHRKCSR